MKMNGLRSKPCGTPDLNEDVEAILPLILTNYII